MIPLRHKPLRGLAAALVAALGALVVAGCAGGTSNSAPPQQTQVPTIAGFSPASGPSGSSVTITGTNLTGATSVAFNGMAAAFSVTSATQITATVPSGATTGRISVTTSSGTAASAASFTVTVPPPTITSFSPTSGSPGTSVTLTGSRFTGATRVTFNGTSATFGVTDDSHISTSVPAGATSGSLSVTTAGGTASSASGFTVTVPSGLDLTIDGLYVTQATQNYPAHDVPLVAGRSAWVRVFVLANQGNSAQPQVRVRFINGSTTNTLTINALAGSVLASVDVENVAASWNAAVPAAWIAPGVQVVADVDPSNLIAESNEGNNQSTQNLDVRTLNTWKITLFPVKTGDGRTGVVENANRTRNDLVDFAKRLFPVPDSVDVNVAAQMTSSVQTLDSSGGGWSTVLSEVLAKRTADGVTDRYYFGLVNVGYTSGVAGIGYIGAPAAIGWDLSSAPRVLAHEEGHNFGRQHSPCGGASNPDPQYPYAGALIGVPGWDAFATSNNLITSANHTDIMAYCSNQWISDYVYKSVVAFRESNSFGIVATDAVAGDAAEGVLVWGRIEDDRVILEPAFRIPAVGRSLPEPGPYVWEARDSQGHLLARVPFQAYEVADLPYTLGRQFAFVVPLPARALDALQSLHLLKGDQELARHAPRAVLAPAVSPVRIHELLGRAVQLDWDDTVHPVLMLRDARTGEVRGFVRGGSAVLEEAPDELEVQFSDGVRSGVMRRERLRP
jgi:hypothetical protein